MRGWGSRRSRARAARGRFVWGAGVGIVEDKMEGWFAWVVKGLTLLLGLGC